MPARRGYVITLVEGVAVVVMSNVPPVITTCPPDLIPLEASPETARRRSPPLMVVLLSLFIAIPFCPLVVIVRLPPLILMKGEIV